MNDMVPMQLEDWVQLMPLLLLTVLVASSPAIIGFIVMRRGRSWVLLALGLAWTVLWLAIALPSLRPARPTAQRNSCIAYLKQLASAKAHWAAENKLEASVVPQFSDLITPAIKSSDIFQAAAA